MVPDLSRSNIPTGEGRCNSVCVCVCCVCCVCVCVVCVVCVCVCVIQIQRRYSLPIISRIVSGLNAVHDPERKKGARIYCESLPVVIG